MMKDSSQFWEQCPMVRTTRVMLIEKSGGIQKYRHIPALQFFNATASFSHQLHNPLNYGAESFQAHIVWSQNPCIVLIYR